MKSNEETSVERIRPSRVVLTAVFTVALAVIPFSLVLGHPGGIDQFGGHLSGPSGKYHFHRGPLADQSFSSKDAALSALRGLAGPQSAREIRLASFNIRIFSDKSRDNRELDDIVSVIKDFDIVAIQELRDTRVISRARQRLQEVTGVEWRFEASDPVGRGVKERYAFLYRIDKVLVKHSGRLIDDPGDRLIREPYFASFRAGNFDFTLLTVHLIYKTKNAPERKLEFDALAEAFVSISDSDLMEKDVILLGDFNDNPTNSRFQAVLNLPGMRCLFQPPLTTTVTDASLYDNICFPSNFVTEYTEHQGIVKFDEIMFDNNDPAASLAVSDHRPVWATFSVDRDDD